MAFPPDPYLPAPAPAPAPAADPAKSPSALAAKFGTPVLASGFCVGCDTTINNPVWCLRQGKNIFEVRHLVDNGHVTPSELAAFITAVSPAPSSPD